MDKFQSFTQLHERVDEWDSQLHDHFEPANALKLEGFRPELVSGNIATNMPHGLLTEHAFRQLSDRLDVPATWAWDNERCPAPVRNYIYGHKFLMSKENTEYLVRMRGTSAPIVRAVLTKEYATYNHRDLVNAMADAVGNLGASAKVFRADVGDELRGYVLLDNIDFGAIGGNEPKGTADGGGAGGLRPAIYFRNSEIGTSRVRITGGLYRDVCSNGMILGWQADEAMAITHRRRSYAHVSVLVNEAIADGLKMSETAAKRFLDMRAIAIPTTSLSSIVDGWAQKYGLTIGVKDNWLSALSGLGEPTMFDVVNAATFQAQSQEGEERETLERMAGDMVFATRPELRAR